MGNDHDAEPMRCPACYAVVAWRGSIVLDSRPSHGGIRRRRQCGDCGARFTTLERVGPADRDRLDLIAAAMLPRLTL